MTDKHDDKAKHKGPDKDQGEVTPNALPDDESGGGGHTDPDGPKKP